MRERNETQDAPCRQDFEGDAMKSKLKEWDERIRSGFLFLSKTIKHNGVEETRWLEFATWQEEVRSYRGRLYWCDQKWIDEETE